jgi:hypothetical protein
MRMEVGRSEDHVVGMVFLDFETSCLVGLLLKLNLALEGVPSPKRGLVFDKDCTSCVVYSSYYSTTNILCPFLFLASHVSKFSKVAQLVLVK